MKRDAGQAEKRILISTFGVYGIVILSVALLLALPCCVEVSEPAGPPPPDLSRCTRVEIRYYPSILDYVFFGDPDENLCSPAELDYLRSLETIVADDQEHIKALARQIRLGSYFEAEGLPGVAFVFHVVCYQNGERLTSFSILGDDIKTEDDQWFKYPKGLGLVAILHALTPQIRPFQLRRSCAGNLSRLRQKFRPFVKGRGIDPAPNKWCDAIVRFYRKRHYRQEYIRSLLKCPSAGKGKCHYAMNPHCEPNSPPDTVLLFETKAGWNQHGGPDLFTFDNHEPRGGCVVLNDGTVKFIRTKEELAQLRWK